MELLNRKHFDTPPVLFASWSGAGNVGILTMDYLRRKLGARIFAKIDMARYITPDSIEVDGGVAHFPQTPQSVFYHHHNPDLVIFESNAHVGGKNDAEILKSILQLARELGTTRIYTAAAIPVSMSHTQDSNVHFATNNMTLIPEFTSLGFNPMKEGVISGLNGLMLGFAASRRIDAVCLLATIPAYAGTLTYPRGALSVVKAMQRVIHVDVDTSELEKECQEAEPMFDEVEGKFKDFFDATVAQQPEPELEQVETDEVPGHVMNKIETLFKAAQKDRSKAKELKDELDKWSLYPLYEDRFLDLFEND
ncbi:PAC2 family protein [Chitinispirillales bacterium ANBcel5]|uniref:PAC2 family protein n=1 Tax=Cellulosispirillum alkaliphilum TaxID=3039283 RepID=UPI002A4EFC4E|nr:PAC2 family protein [Chitinispirillales bacterium ANBcel5]